MKLGDLSAEEMRQKLMTMITLTHNSEFEEWVSCDSYWRAGPRDISVRVSHITGLWVEQ